MSRRSRATRTEGPFALVPCDVLTCDAVRTLPNVALRVLVALSAQYHGSRNGSLTLTRRTAKAFGIGDAHALGASLRELEERGLIVRTRPGSRLPPRSAMFAVTWRQIDEPLAHDPHDAQPTLKPSNAYGSWKCSENRHHWTARRRAARWRFPTSHVAHTPPTKSEMSGAYPTQDRVFPVAHTNTSQNPAVGRAERQGRRPRKAA
jgi:hypothetical protein